MAEIRTYYRDADLLMSDQIRVFDPSQHDEVAVQAHISNISFPQTIKELEQFIYEHGRYNLEDILSEEAGGWTAPKWTKVGDIVFFMHAKSSPIEAIRRLEKQVEKDRNNHNVDYDADIITNWLQHGRELHERYGGKIFAIARAINPAGRLDYEINEVYHFKGRIFVDFGDVTVLDHPIDISEFREYITISRVSGITPLFGQNYLTLKKTIMEKNDMPDWFANSVSTPIPLHQINQSNWMEICLKFRRSFFLETQYREYFVDFLLNEIFTDPQIYDECSCLTNGKPDCYIDNVVRSNGRLVMVEVKLNVRAESNLHQQLTKYAHSTHLKLRKDAKMIPNTSHDKMLVIDTDALYTFDPTSQQLKEIFRLDDLTQHSLPRLKDLIYRGFNMDQ